MSSEALDVEPDEVSGAGRRAGLVGGAARGPGRPQRQRLRAAGERDLRRDDHTRGLRHRDGGHYRRPAPAPGDTRQGRPLHRAADTDRRLAGSGMSDAVLLDGPDPEGGGDAGQTPASAGAPVGVGRSVFRGRALDAILDRHGGGGGDDADPGGAPDEAARRGGGPEMRRFASGGPSTVMAGMRRSEVSALQPLTRRCRSGHDQALEGQRAGFQPSTRLLHAQAGPSGPRPYLSERGGSRCGGPGRAWRSRARCAP